MSDNMNSLGIQVSLAPGDLIANAILVTKIIGEDGQVRVSVDSSSGTTWFDQLALIAAATDLMRSSEWIRESDDE